MLPTVAECAAVQAALSPVWREKLTELLPLIGDEKLISFDRQKLCKAFLSLRLALLHVHHLHAYWCEDHS